MPTLQERILNYLRPVPPPPPSPIPFRESPAQTIASGAGWPVEKDPALQGVWPMEGSSMKGSPLGVWRGDNGRAYISLGRWEPDTKLIWYTTRDVGRSPKSVINHEVAHAMISNMGMLERNEFTHGLLMTMGMDKMLEIAKESFELPQAEIVARYIVDPNSIPAPAANFLRNFFAARQRGSINALPRR